jgi:hypothetical protein
MVYAGLSVLFYMPASLQLIHAAACPYFMPACQPLLYVGLPAPSLCRLPYACLLSVDSNLPASLTACLHVRLSHRPDKTTDR